MLRLLPGISFLLTSTFPVHSPAFFPEPLPASPVLVVANTVAVLARRIKKVTVPVAGSRVEYLRNIIMLKIHDLWYDDS